MTLDVTTLVGRRADHRWDRVAVGDLVERLTWSTPDKAALVGWTGAFSAPRFERLTYAELDRLADQVAHGLLARGLAPGDRVVMVCENSVDGYAVKLSTAGPRCRPPPSTGCASTPRS